MAVITPRFAIRRSAVRARPPSSISDNPAARPLVEDAQPVLATLANELPSIVSSGRAIAPTLDRLPALVTAGQQLISEAFPALRVLRESELGPTLTAIRGSLFELLGDGRLSAILIRARSLLDQVEALGLPARAARASKRIERVLKVQRRTLAIQERSFNVQAQTLQVQLEALGHIRSIDEKTGGQVPPGVP